VIDGYEKMKPPPPAAIRKAEALGRIIRLYEAWGKPKKVAKWRKKLAGPEEGPAK
jgi:hypothetical protein